MSVTNVTVGYIGPDEPSQPWDPALTSKEAHKLGITKKEYKSAVLIARTAAEEHQSLGTPRKAWEPRPVQNDHLAVPFITDGERELANRLEKEADPVLDEAQELIEAVRANLDEISEDTQPIIAPETGFNYSAAQAVEVVSEHDRKIRRDEAAGQRHHRRASELLQRLAISAPWVEATGFLTFVTFYLNVNLLQPWQDWLAWSFAATVVTVIILGQTWLVRHAAQSHNYAREAHADGHRGEAEQGSRQRNWYIALTGVTAAAITSGMIWRGLGALGDASVGTTAVMVFLAAVTGLLLPTLAYLGTAFDGSTVSRERDSLAADLNDDLDDYLETISSSRRDLATVTNTGDTLQNKIFPDICCSTQELVDAFYDVHGTVRLLIGGLSADPPVKTAKAIVQDAQGNIRGYIGTSIPGAGTVNLDPLFDRWHRLTDLRSQQTGLLRRIDALPPHPWGKSRTS